MEEKKRTELEIKVKNKETKVFLDYEEFLALEAFYAGRERPLYPQILADEKDN